VLLAGTGAAGPVPGSEPASPGAAFTYRGWGANRCVSGSMHEVTLDGERFLLEAGASFGSDSELAAEITPELAAGAQFLILSHAHADHCGRLIELVRKGFRGPVYCTPPTARLLYPSMEQSAKHGDQGQETFYFSANSKKTAQRKGTNYCVHLYPDCNRGSRIKAPQKLTANRAELDRLGAYYCGHCAALDAERALQGLTPVPAGEEFSPSEKLRAVFYPTPHLPGAGMVLIKNPATGHSLLFGGDSGSGLSPFLAPESLPPGADWAIIEGTYGPERNQVPTDSRSDFRRTLGELLKAGKRVVIPAFTLDRSQQLIYEYMKGKQEGVIPPGEILLYSSSAEEFTRIYEEELPGTGNAAFFSPEFLTGIPFSSHYRSSREIAETGYGKVAIATSGMGDAGFSREFIKRYIGDPETVFVFVGYQDPETLGGSLVLAPEENLVVVTLKSGEVIRGRKLAENTGSLLVESDGKKRALPKAALAGVEPGIPNLTIDGRSYPVKARILQFNCFSGHARPEEILENLKKLAGLKTVLIVHSEGSTAERLRDYYSREIPGVEFIVPVLGEELVFNPAPEAKRTGPPDLSPDRGLPVGPLGR